jgi:hypothetical protein
MSVVVNAVEKVLDTAVKTVEAVIKDPLPTLATIGLSLVGIPPAVTQAAITAARGGDLEDIAKSAAIAYATPTVAAKLAPTVSTAVNSVVTNQAAANALTAATSQSLVAGSLTAATGGDWQQAAAGAFAGSMAASGYDNYVAPEVMAQAKSLGLSAESHANIQGALKSGIASGAGAAATGGDFATGFANAVVESGWENLTAKASEGLQDVKKSFLKDSDIKDNNPTFAGVSDALVDEVPMSLEGQLAQISSTPKSPEYGKQFGPALAASEYIDIPGYSPARISGYETITDNVPEDVAGVMKPIVVEGEYNQSQFIEDLKKSAISGNFADLQEATQFGKLPEASDGATQNGYLSGKDINRILSNADESAAAAVEARLAASVAPTPENIAAAEQAKLAAELDQKALDGLTKTDVPVGVEGEAVAAPTIDQTNESILKAILGGGETTGAPAPVAGQTGQDLLTVEDLQQAGLSDSSSFGDAGGISDPIDSQQGPLGTMTGNIPMPQTMQRPMSGAPMPQPGAPMPQGGLQFSSFNRVGTPTYFGGAPSTLSALGPLSDLDMQSIMMMSPEEYAARTKSGNIFRVARGGLIALKKQR